MDDILAPIQDVFEGQIDFKGQKLADTLCTTLLTLSGLIAFALGYINNDIYITLWTGLAGTFLAFLIVVPPWPFYNLNPEAWIGSTMALGKGITVS